MKIYWIAFAVIAACVVIETRGSPFGLEDLGDDLEKGLKDYEKGIKDGLDDLNKILPSIAPQVKDPISKIIGDGSSNNIAMEKLFCLFGDMEASLKAPSDGLASSGFILSHKVVMYDGGQNCKLTLKLPSDILSDKKYEVVLNVENVDLRPYRKDSVTIHYTDGNDNQQSKTYSSGEKISNYRNEMFRSRGNPVIEFVTENVEEERDKKFKGFQIVYTVAEVQDKCDANRKRCDNGLCIYEGLWCDTHDHCGDGSDWKKCPKRIEKISPNTEFEKTIDEINKGINTARIVGIVIGVIILVVLVVIVAVILIRRRR